MNFECFKCNKTTEYLTELYEEEVEKAKNETTVALDRIYIHFVKCNHCGSVNRFEYMLRNKNGVATPTNRSGRPPSVEEEFYLSLAGEFVKNNIKFTNDVLRQLATLNTAFLAVTTAFLNSEVIKLEFKVFIIVFYLLSLCVAIRGMLPVLGKVSFRNPDMVKSLNDQTLKFKLDYIKYSVALFGLGFVLTIIAGIWKVFNS